MITKQATKQEFEQAFYFIERLWDYNVYDKEAVRNVYKEILAEEIRAKLNEYVESVRPL